MSSPQRRSVIHLTGKRNLPNSVLENLEMQPWQVEFLRSILGTTSESMRTSLEAFSYSMNKGLSEAVSGLRSSLVLLDEIAGFYSVQRRVTTGWTIFRYSSLMDITRIALSSSETTSYMRHIRSSRRLIDMSTWESSSDFVTRFSWRCRTPGIPRERTKRFKYLITNNSLRRL